MQNLCAEDGRLPRNEWLRCTPPSNVLFDHFVSLREWRQKASPQTQSFTQTAVTVVIVEFFGSENDLGCLDDSPRHAPPGIISNTSHLWNFWEDGPSASAFRTSNKCAKKCRIFQFFWRQLLVKAWEWQCEVAVYALHIEFWSHVYMQHVHSKQFGV